MNKSLAKKIIYIALIILWMGVIFALSNMGAEGSGQQSIELSKLLVDNGANILHNIGIIKEMPAREELDSIIEFIHPPVRKCAHAVEYFVLALLLMMALRDKDTWHLEMSKSVILTLLICLIYSISDELHQYFIPGRSCEFTDCINDVLGATVGIIVYIICHKIHHLIRQPKKALKSRKNG